MKILLHAFVSWHLLISFHGSLCEIISVTLTVVCNRASSIFGDALLKVVQNLYCNVSMML